MIRHILCFCEMLISQPTGRSLCRMGKWILTPEILGADLDRLSSQRERRPWPATTVHRQETVVVPAVWEWYMVSILLWSSEWKQAPEVPDLVQRCFLSSLCLCLRGCCRFPSSVAGPGTDFRLWHLIVRFFSIAHSWWKDGVVKWKSWKGFQEMSGWLFLECLLHPWCRYRPRCRMELGVTISSSVLLPFLLLSSLLLLTHLRTKVCRHVKHMVVNKEVKINKVFSKVVKTAGDVKTQTCLHSDTVSQDSIRRQTTQWF